MTDVAARKLFDLVSRANVAFTRQPSVKALEGAEVSDFAELISSVVNLVRDTRDEILRAEFTRENHAASLLQRLDDSQRAVLNSLAKRGSGNTTGPLVHDIHVERFLNIAEQLENAGILAAEMASREDMVGETEALIAEVKNWDLGDYAKRTLLIQLNYVVRVVQVADTYSDADLRMRVREVIANFAAEFAEMDKKHQTHLERLLMWARRGFFTGTVVLGLTADVATVTALLPAPPLQLGSR
ncbi:hypothetical protein CEW88_04795 [Alloyangia pacifica]|uniref:Uncharacterized protein n=1 Tax=Alloyangia pacifica TaxID=311180 RepID=A0A2U8HBC8_9RHOB|nr:hypothetical protein [Alloyangia pacifica]AWI83038.1 hypothetical protein CEW88_04795 [Alloyangia pacifica]